MITIKKMVLMLSLLFIDASYNDINLIKQMDKEDGINDVDYTTYKRILLEDDLLKINQTINNIN